MAVAREQQFLTCEGCIPRSHLGDQVFSQPRTLPSERRLSGINISIILEMSI